jgi:hypothetical protein
VSSRRAIGAREAPTVSELASLCHRVRAAGAPGGPARSRLVKEYREAAEAYGAPVEPIVSGRDLEHAAAALLRRVSRSGTVRRVPG